VSTHNITGNHLHDKTLNVLNNGSETINVFGVTRMDPSLQSDDHLTVNLEAHSEWVGGFTIGQGSTATIKGAGEFYNQSTTINGGSATIGANVIGTGIFTENNAHGHGKLEFLHGVSAGQTVDALGGGVVQVDNPSAYNAFTALVNGEVVLEGLKATSFSYNKTNDQLTLFNGHKLVDTLKVGVPGPFSRPGVSQVGSSIDISNGNFTGGHALPLHG
jgi:hypothetical protein